MEYKKVRKLNAKQERYAREYAVCGNTSKAARAVGYSINQGFKLNKSPAVIEFIEMLRANDDAEAALSAKKVIRELGQIAFSNLLDYVNPKTGAVRLEGIDRAKAAAIIEYTVTETRAGDKVTKIKLADKIGGLDRLARHLGIYEADNNQKAAIIHEPNARDLRELARRVTFLLRDSEPTPMIATVLDGEFVAVDSKQASESDAVQAPLAADSAG